MRGEWCYFKSYFSKEWCDGILSSVRSDDYRSSFIGQEGEILSDFRKSKVFWLKQNDLKWDKVYKDIWKLEREANHEWFGFHVDGCEDIQLTRYDGKNEDWYGRHRDTFFMTQNTHRKLSATIQLTDPNEYEGGDFTMFECEQDDPNKNEIRQQGTVLFFPSFMYHQVNPVTKGIRNSLVVWFTGPHWR